MVLVFCGPFSDTLNTRGSLLRILLESQVKTNNKGYHFETVSDFLFLSQKASEDKKKSSFGGGGFTRPIPGDGGADQLRGVPVTGRLPTDGTRGPEVIGNGRIWPDADGPVQGVSSTRCERSCDLESLLLHEGVSVPPTLWR